MSVNCPRCGKPAEALQGLDVSLLRKLKENGETNTPNQVCQNCLNELAGAGRGGVLLSQAKMKEQKKLMLWKNRVGLIKRARQFMAEKKYSDAAVSYEKYIRSLEVVFDVKAGELSPENFKDSAKTQELTVVASVYWDLLRIYDTSNKYGDRQKMVATKLAQFLRFTPIFPDIVKKAEAFQKTAKNSEAVRHFLKLASESRGRCFIATSAFESPFANEVLYLARYRDNHLEKKFLGRAFVNFYYLISPAFARLLDKLSFLKPAVRWALRQVISLIDRAHRH